MPKRKRTRGKNGSRRVRRKYPLARRRTGRIRRPHMFGNKSAVVKMQYTVNQTTVGGPGPETFIYRANSAYDPEQAIGGGQPHFFDQAFQYFDHGTVMGSKIVIQGSSNSSVEDMLVVIRTSDNTTLVTDPQEMLEASRSHWKFVPAAAGYNSQKFTISQKFSSKKFFGKTKNSIIGDSLYRMTSGANPAEDAYYHVTFRAPDQLKALASQQFLVTIFYYVVMTEPRLIGTST